LDGEQTRIIFVRGVIAFATSSARTWKFSLAFVGTLTGRPPASLTMSL